MKTTKNKFKTRTRLNKLKQHSLFLILAMLSISCGGDEVKLLNFAGSATKDNSYEHLNVLPNQLYTVYKAKEEFGGSTAPLLVLNSGKVIIAGNNGKIVCMLGDASYWTYQLPSNEYVYNTIVADGNDNIYFITYGGQLISLDNNGKERWKLNHNDNEKIVNKLNIQGLQEPLYNDLIIEENKITIASSHSRAGVVSQYDFTGKLIWQYATSLSIIGLASDEKGNIYANGNDYRTKGCDSLICITSSGKLNYSIPFINQTLVKYPVISQEKVFLSTLIAGDEGLSKLYSISLDGKQIYEKEIAYVVRNLSVAKDGSCYFTCFNSGLGSTKTGIFAFNPKGEKVWQLFIEYSLPHAPLISQEEIALAGTNQNSMGIYYIDRITGKLLRVQDIGTADPLNYKPYLNNEGCIFIASSNQSSYLKVDNTLIDKLFH